MVVTWCLLVRFPIATTRMITETFEPDIHFPLIPATEEGGHLEDT